MFTICPQNSGLEFCMSVYKKESRLRSIINAQKKILSDVVSRHILPEWNTIPSLLLELVKKFCDKFESPDKIGSKSEKNYQKSIDLP